MALSMATFGQNLTQVIRGSIEDADSKSPLIGANVVLLDTDPNGGIKGVITDVNGNFRISDVPTEELVCSFPTLDTNQKRSPILLSILRKKWF